MNEIDRILDAAMSSSGEAQDTTTYRYRDKERRKNYMRGYMREYRLKRQKAAVAQLTEAST